MRWVVVGLVSAMALLGCGSGTPSCGMKPKQPTAVRSATFFGRVTADPRGWTIGQNGSARAHIVVGGRELATDAQTERLGYCGAPFDPKRCSAFVGVRRPGVADWVLLAQPRRFPPAGEQGRLEIYGVTVWKVQTTSLVLSEGVELRFGQIFAAKLRSTNGMTYGLRRELEGRQVGTTLWIDAHSGEVLDAGVGGCA